MLQRAGRAGCRQQLAGGRGPQPGSPQLRAVRQLPARVGWPAPVVGTSRVEGGRRTIVFFGLSRKDLLEESG